MSTLVLVVLAASAVVSVLAVLWGQVLPGVGLRGDSTMPSNRVRRLRIRLRLRLRPGPGHATAGELWLRWSRLAILRGSGRARPSVPLRVRMVRPVLCCVLLGWAQWRHALRLPLEEHVLILAGPRTGKSALLGHMIMRYPGPVLSTTTKADIFGLTAGIRARRGPVYVFNPQAVGEGVPSTFRWDLIAGCADQATAIRRATALCSAIDTEGMEGGSWWAQKAQAYFRALLHAAALAHGDMRLVTAWTVGSAEDAEHVLAARGRHDLAGAVREMQAEDPPTMTAAEVLALLEAESLGVWRAELAQLRGPADKTNATIRMVMSQCLAFMADPQLALSVLPGPGAGFDIPAFLAASGTLYLIASAEQDNSPVAPLFACLANEVHWIAQQIGQSMPGGRLDPPLLMALDEITQTCPVPLDKWLADSGGKGCQIATVAHGEAQLRARWGQHGAEVIVDTAGALMLLPGIKDPDTLEHASDLCGSALYRMPRQEQDSAYPVMTVAMIRQLPPFRALVIRGGLSPVVAKLPKAWRSLAYTRARVGGYARLWLPSAPMPVELSEPLLPVPIELAARLAKVNGHQPGPELAQALPAGAPDTPWSTR